MINRTIGSNDWTAEELHLEKIKIDKGVPRRPRYPHAAFTNIAKKMKIGDSVYTEDSRVLSGLTQALNKIGCLIETRTERTGKRLWRVA